MNQYVTLLELLVDDDLRADARRALDAADGTMPQTVRAVLGRIAERYEDHGAPPHLTAPSDPAERDGWMRAKVQESLDDPRPSVSHDEVMLRTQAIIDRYRGAGS